jgi:hypothetical protein
MRLKLLSARPRKSEDPETGAALIPAFAGTSGMSLVSGKVLMSDTSLMSDMSFRIA